MHANSGERLKYRVGVRGFFSAAHRIEDHSGECSNIHGHTYVIDVVVEGYRLKGATNMLVDIGVLKKILKLVLEVYDHKYLNEVLGERNTTCKILALDIMRKFKEKLPPGDFKIRVRVAESPDSWIEVIEE